MAGAILGMANASYIKEHTDQIVEVSPGSIYRDKKTGLILYEVGNKTYVGEGISYLTPVKKEWVIGVARVRIPIVGYVRLIPNIIGDEIHKLLGGS
jgi:signal peptidase